MSRRFCAAILFTFLFWNCNKNSGGDPTPPPVSFKSTGIALNGKPINSLDYNTDVVPVLKFNFSSAVNRSTVNRAFSFADKNGATVPYLVSYENNDNTIIIQPSSNLKYLTKYSVKVSNSLQSATGGSLTGSVSVNFVTKIDSSRKFAVISDNALLDLVQ